MHKSPLLWFTFENRMGQRWRVFLSCKAISPMLKTVADGDPAEGYADFQHRVIVVDGTMRGTRIDETLIHELGHVAADERDGIDPLIEESAVLYVANPLIGLLRGKPFNLKLPPKPKGLARLRKWARLVEKENDPSSGDTHERESI